MSVLQMILGTEIGAVICVRMWEICWGTGGFCHVVSSPNDPMEHSESPMHSLPPRVVPLRPPDIPSGIYLRGGGRLLQRTRLKTKPYQAKDLAAAQPSPPLPLPTHFRGMPIGSKDLGT